MKSICFVTNGVLFDKNVFFKVKNFFFISYVNM